MGKGLHALGQRGQLVRRLYFGLPHVGAHRIEFINQDLRQRIYRMAERLELLLNGAHLALDGERILHFLVHVLPQLLEVLGRNKLLLLRLPRHQCWGRLRQLRLNHLRLHAPPRLPDRPCEGHWDNDKKQKMFSP